MLSVPVVDLSLLKGDKTQREKLFEDLRYAAHTIGFFYLVGHDVDWNLCQKLFALSKKFFALPLEEKLKISIDNSPHLEDIRRWAGNIRLVLKIGERRLI